MDARLRGDQGNIVTLAKRRCPLFTNMDARVRGRDAVGSSLVYRLPCSIDRLPETADALNQRVGVIEGETESEMVAETLLARESNPGAKAHA
jgi:hypothetical protein